MALTDPLVTDARSGDAVALARCLVAIPSVNPGLEAGGDGEHRIAAFCHELLHGWGLRPASHEVAPGRVNVVGTLEGTGPTLLLNGHLDTVGVAGMTIDPFAGELREGRIYGRGACDMKGGVAALLATAYRLTQVPPTSRPQLMVALTADEEDASIGMEAFSRAGVAADLAVVCEPTELTVMPAHKGFAWIRTVFEGRAAHGSRPDLGVDAIRHAARYLAALDALEAELAAGPAHPLLGRPSFHAGTVTGGAAPSVYPDRCELVLERRTLPGESRDEVVAPLVEALEALSAALPEVRAALDVVLERPGTEVPESAPVVRGLLAALEAEGRPARVRGMSAWVDAAYLNEAGVPAVCFGPGSISQAHTVDEWIEAGQIETCANVLERLALGLAG